MEFDPTLEYAMACQWQSKLEDIGFEDLGGEVHYYRQGWCIKAKWYEFLSPPERVGFAVECQFSAREMMGFAHIHPRHVVRFGMLLIELLGNEPERRTSARVRALKLLAENNTQGYVELLAEEHV